MESIVYPEFNEIDSIVEEPKVSYDFKQRTKQFAYKAYELCEMLPNTYYGNHLKSQLFRSSSSVAANYRATCLAQSKATFIAKISIVLEEVDESAFWLEFILENQFNDSELLKFLIKEASELTAIFNASRKTAKNNLKNT